MSGLALLACDGLVVHGEEVVTLAAAVASSHSASLDQVAILLAGVVDGSGGGVDALGGGLFHAPIIAHRLNGVKGQGQK